MFHRLRQLAGVVPLLVLVALAAVCFARLVGAPGALIVDGDRPSIDHATPGEPRGLGNDATFSFLPHHLWIGRVIRTFGHLPSWDDRGFCGRPLAGNPQAGVCYPPVWLVWWSGAPAALGWLTVGHLLWGGIGMYVLVRSFPAGRWPATVAAAIYQASPLQLAHTFEGHYPHVWAACWYPWAFWAYSRQRSGRLRGQLFLPVILALTFLTGHPQEWFLLVMALSAWSFYDLWRARRACETHQGAAKLVAWAGVLALSIGFAAVEAAPQLAVRPWLMRNAITMPPLVSRSPGAITSGISVRGSCSVRRPLVVHPTISATTTTGKHSVRLVWCRWSSRSLRPSGILTASWLMVGSCSRPSRSGFPADGIWVCTPRRMSSCPE